MSSEFASKRACLMTMESLEMSSTSSVFDLPGWSEGGAATPTPSTRVSSGATTTTRRSRASAGASTMQPELVPWATVEDALAMAMDALAAKQRVAEVRCWRGGEGLLTCQCCVVQ